MSLSQTQSDLEQTRSQAVSSQGLALLLLLFFLITKLRHALPRVPEADNKVELGDLFSRLDFGAFTLLNHTSPTSFHLFVPDMFWAQGILQQIRQ